MVEPAEAMGHHPDLEVSWDKVTVTISTHSEGGLTEADFELAAEDRLPIPERLRIDERLSIPLAEVELRASRSSGPGGQHANVTASRVEAVFDVEASRGARRGAAARGW